MTPRAKIVLLYNFKGGVGKTSSCVGFASAATQEKIPVGMADCNEVQGSLAEWLQLRKKGGLKPVIHGDRVDPADLMKVAEAAGAAGAKVLFVDCPPDYHERHEASLLKFADMILIPVLMSGVSIRGTKKCLAMLKSHARFKNPGHPPVAMFSIEATSAKAGANKELGSIFRKMSLNFGVPILKTTIPYSFAQTDASIEWGRLHCELSKRSVGNAYRDAFLEVCEVLDFDSEVQ